MLQLVLIWKENSEMEQLFRHQSLNEIYEIDLMNLLDE